MLARAVMLPRRIARVCGDAPCAPQVVERVLDRHRKGDEVAKKQEQVAEMQRYMSMGQWTCIDKLKSTGPCTRLKGIKKKKIVGACGLPLFFPPAALVAATAPYLYPASCPTSPRLLGATHRPCSSQAPELHTTHAHSCTRPHQPVNASRLHIQRRASLVDAPQPATN